ncbi:hypothetical protein BGW36DRAFT_362583 [Talaromyces proteolyticus]|uniref:Uncharacterized protein n=1 Tax=Talaromyces proteolyticus TaxID=1131652 RepID=A0AAD4PV86_9EURO|nr:uncharacterized protein BGW36DRAFT_362583 [Talaromyces proteolyticus]KAH8693044.1 hypothetical protein BGW36DRAFT_362583 [Talaromyces proteolyticus]
MPDFTLGPLPPNDPNYMSLSDSRLLEYNPASEVGHLPPAYIDVVKVPTVARFAEALALLIDELSCVGGSWFILQSYIQDHPLLDLDDLEPHIRRHYKIAQEEYGVKGRVRYSENVVAKMMEANELPPRPPQFIDKHSCLFGLDVEK